jgi:hypothetical protein
VRHMADTLALLPMMRNPEGEGTGSPVIGVGAPHDASVGACPIEGCHGDDAADEEQERSCG